MLNQKLKLYAHMERQSTPKVAIPKHVYARVPSTREKKEGKTIRELAIGNYGVIDQNGFWDQEDTINHKTEYT